ncbi:hypothetical protein FB451DRAFT_668110 [Mycena latifolia]|nr:hypothetical protein FB451DRAFT_668110 [Mycena latifolia]
MTRNLGDLETGAKSDNVGSVNRYQELISSVVRWLRPGQQTRKPAVAPKSDPDSHSQPYSETENDEACEKLWEIYASEAERYDAALVESWKGDMEGMLIFSGLFSASVTAFLIESYKSLTPDTGDLAVQLLTRLSQQIAGEATSSPPAPFRVPSWSIICNTLWFTSLTLSLTCALLATLVEQWAREFMHKTEMRPSPVSRARLVSFLYFGVERFGMPAIVEVLPMLLHLSLLLFFSGLVVFLIPVNEVVMALVGCIFGIFVLLYSILTVLPTIALDCPYRTPLSGVAWKLIGRLRNLLVISSADPPAATLTQAVMKSAFNEPQYRDERAILWTVESLTDDNELLPFVEAIPDVVFGPKGFRQVNDHLFGSVLSTADQHASLGHRLSNLLRDAQGMPDADPLKQRKQMSSLRALWALCTAAARLPSSRKGSEFLRWLAHMNNYLDQQKLPPGLRISCSAVVTDTIIETMRGSVGDIRQKLEQTLGGGSPRSSLLDVQVLTTALEVQLAEPFMQPTSQQLSLDQVKEIKRLLQNNDRTSGLPDALIAATLVHDDPGWWIAKIQNISGMLQNALNSGSTPYNLEMTCRHIFPELLGSEWHEIRRKLVSNDSVVTQLRLMGTAVQVALPAYQQWAPHVAAQSPTSLDYMMRIVFRLLPFLQDESTLPLVYWYLANRRSMPPVFQDQFQPIRNQRSPDSFLEAPDKSFLESKFIDSMRAINPPNGILEAVATYYMLGINSDENIDRVYRAATDLVQSQLSRGEAQDSEAIQTAPLSTYISVKAILTRTQWGHLQRRLRDISRNSQQYTLDEGTRIVLAKIIQHPFLINHEPNLDEVTAIKPACSSIQHMLDEAYTSTLDDIVESCKQDGPRAFALVGALQAMCTFPEHLLSVEHHLNFIKNILRVLSYIRKMPGGAYRSSVLALLPAILDWFTDVTTWTDDSGSQLLTAILVESLEIYYYENGARQDMRAIRAVQLRNHFLHLLPPQKERVSNPDRFKTGGTAYLETLREPTNTPVVISPFILREDDSTTVV